MTDTALFSAPWDQKLTLLTVAGSTLLLLGATLAGWVSLTMVPPGPGRILILAGGVLSLGALVFGALLAPRGYTVAGDRLTIDRRDESLGGIRCQDERLRGADEHVAITSRGVHPVAPQGLVAEPTVVTEQPSGPERPRRTRQPVG